MNDDETISVMDLSFLYAKFFAEDFAVKVMQQLQGSYPALGNNNFKAFISDKVKAAFNLPMSPVVFNGNAITRFVYECAKYAVDNNVPDKTSYASWATISELPSVHHDEIQAIIYSAAITYNTTVSGTILGVIARDVASTSKAISQAAAARTANGETGGSLSIFNWGILNDGMWLNGALLKAFDTALIFRPGQPVVAYYTTTALQRASGLATMPLLSNDDVMYAQSQLDMIISHVENPDFTENLLIVSQGLLNDILFNAGTLEGTVRSAEAGLRDISRLIEVVRNLSAMVRILNTLLETANNMENGDLIGDLLMERMVKALDVVTLILVGYEALRETKFSETLIMSVTPANEVDPVVDVIINGDMINSYHAAGGEDSDLVRFGSYLDPRKGMPINNTGYTLEYVLERRVNVVAHVISEDSERLDKLRRNDAAVIQKAALSIIDKVVRSYMEASMMPDLPIPVYQSINTLVRNITNPDVVVDLDREILTILASVTNDPFVCQVANRLGNYMSSTSEFDVQNAAVLTIAETAVSDAVTYITASE